MASAIGGLIVAQGDGTPSTDVVAFNATIDGGKVSEVVVRCTAGTVNVNVPGLHKIGEYFPIPSGLEERFRHSAIGIAYVNVQGKGGAATIDFAVVSKRDPTN